MNRSLILILTISLLLVGIATAEIPQLINYQGTLLNSGGTPVADDTYSVTFAIYDEASGGAEQWSEIQTIETTNGSFSVLLGTVEPIHDSVFADIPRYLSITVGGEEMTPRMNLVSVPWSHRVSTIDGTTGGSITGGITIGVDELVDGNAIIITNLSGDTLFRAAIDQGSTSVAIWEVGEIKGELGATGETKKVELNQDGITVFGATESDTSIMLGVEGGIQITVDELVDGNALIITNGNGDTTFRAAIDNAGNTSVAIWEVGEIKGMAGAAGGNKRIEMNKDGITVFGTTETDTTILIGPDGNVNVRSGGIKFADSTVQFTQAGASNGLPQPGGTMTGPIASVGDPQITMGKANFGSSNTNAGATAFVAGTNNTASGPYSTIGGGIDNIADDTLSTVCGGSNNNATGKYSVIAGGGNLNAMWGNSASGQSSSILGGSDNSASATGSFVGGGSFNVASGHDAAIAGGGNNTAQGMWSAIAGGHNNRANSVGSIVSGGVCNLAHGGYSVVAGGGGPNWVDSNSASGDFSVIGGGRTNTTSNHYTTIGGGWGNTASGDNATIGGGGGNDAIGGDATVGGGTMNWAGGNYSTISGGDGNLADSNFSTIGGGRVNLARANSATVGGGAANDATAYYATVSGGTNNQATDTACTVGGGSYNYARGKYSVIAGGGSGDEADSNSASGDWSAISGGKRNSAKGNYTTVSGGLYNSADTLGATVSGGESNWASKEYATVGGGLGDTASGQYSTVPGGNNNTASGSLSFAAGYYGKATHNRSWVWSGGSAYTYSWGASTFTARASGGVRFYSANDTITGVSLSGGSGAWATLSDQNSKTNINEVDYSDILLKIDQLPISEWNYKSQDESIKHIGPMAQDFHRLFGVGEDDKHLSTIDPDGVALAAIKALNEKSKEVDQLRIELAELRQMVEALTVERNDQK